MSGCMPTDKRQCYCTCHIVPEIKTFNSEERIKEVEKRIDELYAIIKTSRRYTDVVMLEIKELCDRLFVMLKNI